MAKTTEELPTKERILSVCVRLFLEKGYTKTTVSDITKQAGVSNSSFQHFFRAKDGVLTELVKYMFDHQFNIAHDALGQDLPPMYSYCAGAAVQLTLAELSENLRELYIHAYVHPEPLGFVQRATGERVAQIFGLYQPELSAGDFQTIVLGTTGMMLGFMAHPCDKALSLEQKIRRYLTSELRVYKVPEAEIEQVVAFVLGMDVRTVARKAMDQAVRMLAAHFDFSPSDIDLPSAGAQEPEAKARGKG